MLKRILLTALASNLLHAQPEQIDLITKVTAKKNMLNIEINEQFKKKYLTNDFFAEYEESIDLSKLHYSIQIMPVIMNVISIVWISGKTYYVDSMDEELYASLKKVKKVLKRLYVKTKWKGRLIPRSLVKNQFKPVQDKKERMALLFSGGVDSTASSLFHREKKQLLVTAWGHWDLPLSDKQLIKTRKRQIEKFGEEHGHENSFIRSNYYSFLNRRVLDTITPEIVSWRIFTVEGIGWAGLVAPLLLLKGYPLLYHGSSITWDFPYPAAANPFIDDNIRFSEVGVKHDMFDINRLEKCAIIADIVNKQKLSKPFVRVCEEKIVANCSKCQKCVRTALEFFIIGEDPKPYGFNISFERTIDLTKKILRDPATVSTTVWHFKHIQELLQSQKDAGQKIHPEFEWLLEYPVEKKLKRRTFDIRHTRRVDWQEFIDLLPSIEVPQKYKNQRP